MTDTGRPMRALVALARLYTRVASPVGFVARRFIGAVAEGAAVRRADGLCLDVGAGVAPYRSAIAEHLGMTRYVAMDMAASDATSLVADGCRMPFADGTFDLAVSFDVVQHVEAPERMLDEMARVLVPGGHVLLTYPFLYAECDVRDFQRWTIEGMEHALRSRGLDVIVSERRGGACFAVACGINWALQHAIPGQRRSWRAHRSWMSVARAAVIALLTLPTTLLAWVALAIDRVLPARGAYMGGVILARKPGEATR